jgi:hypothetical protein
MNLVYLSPVPWGSFAQRPHKFVDWFRSERGGEVLWIDPYPTRLPNIADIWRPSDLSLIGIPKPDWIKVIRPWAIPIEPLPLSGIINGWLWQKIISVIEQFTKHGEAALVIGKPSELAVQVLNREFCKLSIYDAMDNFPAFLRGLSRSSLSDRESQIVKRVSQILVSSTALFNRFGSERDVLLVRNACDMQSLPPLEAVVARRREIFGYVGTIGSWFDWELVTTIARVRPKAEIHLVGPMFVRPPASLPENVMIFPACSHKEAIAKMQEFSIGLIPFLNNELTDSVDPIKYYEYRALGLPVVASTFGEMYFHQSDPGLSLLDMESDIRSVIEMARARFSPDMDEMREFRHKNSWQVRFSSINFVD